MEQSAYDVVERVGFDGYGTGLANAGGAQTYLNTNASANLLASI